LHYSASIGFYFAKIAATRTPKESLFMRKRNVKRRCPASCTRNLDNATLLTAFGKNWMDTI